MSIFQCARCYRYFDPRDHRNCPSCHAAPASLSDNEDMPIVYSTPVITPSVTSDPVSDGSGGGGDTGGGGASGDF